MLVLFATAWSLVMALTLLACRAQGADGAAPPSHSNRFQSDAPGLSLHGQVDSWCGIRWGYYVAQPMPNLQLVELQGLTAQ